ncbi:MAG TPA: PilZ domain-containing protein [Sphingomicrobium sp.]|nr:PilZ domain-containing protein [Sphingomicrobium sp.]
MPDSDQRSQERSNVFLAATLLGGARPTAVRIRNISVSGALVEAPSLPSPGTAVRLVRGDLSARGMIAWVSASHGGLTFLGPIDVEAWVKRVGHSGQQRVDGVVAALRSSGPVPPDLLDGRGADTLRSISAELDEVCENLATSAEVSIAVGEQLLKLDSIAHALRQIASDRTR